MNTVSNIPEERGANGNISVYRNKRQAEIITAVRILPFTYQNTTGDDENIVYFNTEAAKLNALNDYPCLNLVKILNTGILPNSGSPYLEMEFIEGPHLEELLKTSFNPVFPLTEVINVAVQLANALAHCHHAGIIHGQLKNTNVKLNQHTGNYVLLGFGMALIPPKFRMQICRDQPQGFWAPEQKNGDLLFETDIYSYAALIYYLLCGSLPSMHPEREPLNENTFRSDLISAREKNIPSAWADDRKQRELEIPKWLTDLLLICFQNEPVLRFKSGSELQQYIADKSKNVAGTASLAGGPFSLLVAENERLSNMLHQKEEEEAVKTQEISRMKALLIQKDGQLDVFRYQSAEFAPKKSAVYMSKPAVVLLATIFAALSGYAVYSAFIKENPRKSSITAYSDTLPSAESLDQADSTEAKPPGSDSVQLKTSIRTENNIPDQAAGAEKVPEPTAKSSETSMPEKPVNSVKSRASQNIPRRRERSTGEPSVFKSRYDKFTLDVPKAYLHSQPDESTRRNIFMADSNYSELTALRDSNNFIYVIFFNSEGEIIRGWLRKKDLRRIN